MPSSEALLSIFITMCGAGSVGQGSICQWIDGLKLWHCVNEAPWYGGAELERAIQGTSHFTPPSSFSSKRDLIYHAPLVDSV